MSFSISKRTTRHVVQLREIVIERETLSAIDSLRLHWPEYLMEAVEVALYLFLTCVFASLLLYPASPVRIFLGSAGATRALMGLAVGATVVAIVVSPWGQQSGGHFNTRASLAAIPGLAEAQPLTHIEALELDQVPEHLLVIGGGYVGIELSQAMRRFGSDFR